MPVSPLTPDRVARVNQLSRTIADEVARAFIGNPTITEALLVALMARGHVLIEGYPGVAKTTLVKAFSGTLGQFVGGLGRCLAGSAPAGQAPRPAARTRRL